MEIKDIIRLCGRCERIRIQQDKIRRLVNETIPGDEAAGRVASAAKHRLELVEAERKLAGAIASPSSNN